MSLRDTLRAGVRTMHNVFSAGQLETELSYVRVISRDEYGAITESAAATPLHAIIDWKDTPVRNKEGITVTAFATLTLLDVDEVAAATNSAGVTHNDEFTLPNGSTGKVVSIGGFMDSGTFGPIPLTVYLG